MASINLTSQGIHTIGNFTNNDVFIIDSISLPQNVKSIKTLINGVWRSWTEGVPPAFQGFNLFESGRGYVLEITAPIVINFSSETSFDIMNMPIIVGENLIALPYNMPVGDTKRFQLSSSKTISYGNWVSWTKGTPQEFQGFLDFHKTQGYFVNITKVFQNVGELSDSYPIYFESDVLLINKVNEFTYYINIPSNVEYLDITKIHILNYTDILRGWDLDRTQNRLYIRLDDTKYYNDLDNKTAIIYGVM
jgi:hypothetical protein